jgi:hypothetical protein
VLKAALFTRISASPAQQVTGPIDSHSPEKSLHPGDTALDDALHFNAFF